MCVFPDAQNAALAACDMQHAIRVLDQDSGESARGFQGRVGLHFGMLLDEGDDVFGDTVNTAAQPCCFVQTGPNTGFWAVN